MAKRLDGKVAIITGAGQGIGAAIAESYAAQDCKVLITGRTLSKLEEIAGKKMEAAEALKLLTGAGSSPCSPPPLARPR